MSFVPEMRCGNEYSRNRMRYATEAEAEGAAKELMSRWTVPSGYRVVPSDEPVNYRFDFDANKNVAIVHPV
jgi:hypothetical protein